MKTKHLIEILRCHGDNRAKCEKCHSLDTCKSLAGQSICEVSAKRLEELLDNLRRTQSELKEAHIETKMWKKRYERFFSNMREVLHEQEVLCDWGY